MFFTRRFYRRKPKSFTIMRKVNGRFVGQIKTAMFGKLRLKTDGTIATAEVASVNKQTPLQMARRITWSNIIANYRVLKEPLREGWENIPQGQSLFNQFISVNARTAPYALTRDDFKAGACIVAPYQITRGSIDPIKVDVSAGVPMAKTNIAVGDLTIDDQTTIAQFAEAIVTNNADWEYGDKLTYISMVQYVKSGVPKVSVSYAAITLLEDSELILSDEVSLQGLKNVGGVLGHDKPAPVGGFCWIHSRHDADNNLHLSNQFVIANNDDMIARYTTVDARLAAALSYGANFRNLVVLEPTDERIKEAYRYFGIKFSDAQGVTKVTPVDISLTGLTYHDKFIFDGDSAVMLDTAVADKIVLSGSNFSALDASSTKVVIDGVEITGATLKDNALTVTLPASLNGKNLQHLVLTDGKISTTLDLTE